MHPQRGGGVPLSGQSGVDPLLHVAGFEKHLILAGLLICLALHFMISSFSWAIVTLLSGIVFLGVSLYFQHVENKELSKTVETQQEAVKALLDQINIRYNDAQLVKEIGQATSMLLDTERLLKAVVDAMQNRLDFDRGGIWLANREKSRLVYRVGFGYHSTVEEVLKKTDFHLDKPHSGASLSSPSGSRDPFSSMTWGRLRGIFPKEAMRSSRS